MKHLIDYCKYVFEDETNTELRKQIIDYVNPKKHNEIRTQDLKKAYQILQSMTDEDFNKLKELYKGNIEGLKSLIKILEKVGQKNQFLLALNDKIKNNFPTFNDLKKENKGNIFELLKDNKFGINSIFNDSDSLDEFLKQLLQERYTIGNKGIGAGELFFITLFQNTGHPKRGDVQIDDEEIEVKCSKNYSEDGPRLVAAKSNALKTVDDISDYFEKQLLEKFDIKLKNVSRNSNDKIIIGSNKKYIDDIYNELKDSISEKDIMKLLLEMYFYQFNNLQKFKNEFDKFISQFNKYDYNLLVKIHLCLSIISYHTVDSWGWLMLIEYSRGNYYMFDGKKCSINNFISNLKYLINNDNFRVGKKPANTDGSSQRDIVAQIYITK